MIFRSNLTAPDLTPHFKHLVSRPLPHSFGHDVPSDWGDMADDDPVFGLYKKCGMWTHDEAAILHRCVERAPGRAPGSWVDIGAHTGWTTAHIGTAAKDVIAVEPMFSVAEFWTRFKENQIEGQKIGEFHGRSDQYFRSARGRVEKAGFVIDGDHEPGKPLEDAKGACAKSDLVIFHDFIGLPVREAVQYLMGRGFHCRVYFTPHMIAVCWRGDFNAPYHIADRELPDLKARCPEFPWERCE